MFVGHYAPAVAGRAASAAVPLWVLFFAVQFLDYIWAVLVLLGVEKGRLVEGFLEASHLDLYYMPFSHSLVGALVWSVVFAAAYVVLAKPAAKGMAALLTGGAVFSHWVADLIVHFKDLPILHGEPKLGFGLWSSLFWSQLVEVGLLVAAGVWLLRTTRPKGFWGRVTPFVLFGVLLLGQAVNHLPTEELPSLESLAAQGLLAFSIFVGLAALVDWTREPR